MLIKVERDCGDIGERVGGVEMPITWVGPNYLTGSDSTALQASRLARQAQLQIRSARALVKYLPHMQQA